MDKLSERMREFINMNYTIGTSEYFNLLGWTKEVAQLEAKAKDMELMATDAMDRYSDAVDKYTDEIAQLEAVKETGLLWIQQYNLPPHKDMPMLEYVEMLRELREDFQNALATLEAV